jgi:hypothetical protein
VPWRHQPGVGHHDIESPEFLVHGVDGIANIVFAADVALQGKPVSWQVRAMRGDIEAETESTGIRQVPHDRSADAGRRTRH